MGDKLFTTENINLLKNKRMMIACLSLSLLKDWTKKNIKFLKENDYNSISEELNKIKKQSKKYKDQYILLNENLSKKSHLLAYIESYLELQKYQLYDEIFNDSFLTDDLIKLIIEKYGSNNLSKILKQLSEYKQSYLIRLTKEKDSCKNEKPKIDDKIIEMYEFIVESQEKLHKIRLNYEYILEESYPKNKDIIDNHEQKSELFKILSDEINKINNLKINRKYVFYKNRVINFKKGEILRVKEKIFNKLKNILKGNISPIFSYYDLSQDFLKDDIFTRKLKYEITPRFYFELSLNCNLNCKYCFNRDKKRYMKLRRDDWFNIAKNLPEKSQLNLFGGEPRIHDDFEGIIEDLNKLDNISELRIFSNGLENISNIIKKYNGDLIVIVSLDGIKGNKKIRGEGLYEKVIENIKLIKKNTKHKVWIKMLLTKENSFEVTDFIDDLENINVDYISFGDLHEDEEIEKKVKLSYSEELKFFEKVNQYIKNKKISFKDDNMYEDFIPNRCGYGHTLVYFRSDGFISGCTEYDCFEKHIFQFFENPEKFKKLDELILNKFKNGFNKKPCKNCKIRNICLGGCYSNKVKKESKCDTIRKKKVEHLLDNIISENDI